MNFASKQKICAILGDYDLALKVIEILDDNFVPQYEKYGYLRHFGLSNQRIHYNIDWVGRYNPNRGVLRFNNNKVPPTLVVNAPSNGLSRDEIIISEMIKRLDICDRLKGKNVPTLTYQILQILKEESI